MRNLQELFDAYLRTEPTAEKIKTATSMLIHIGKALNVPNQEEINREYYTDITRSLDDYFIKTPAKARLDKSILAEMINRVGLKPSLKPILENLLDDKDENVRQFTLQSLEYYGYKNPKAVLLIIDKYSKSDDRMMVNTSAYLAAKLACSDCSKLVLDRLVRWHKRGSHSFVATVLKQIIHFVDKGTCGNGELDMHKLKDWTRNNCPEVIKIFSHL
jgi:hypothetical protein